MKKLFTDTVANITVKQGYTDNGVPVVHLINPISKDFYIATQHKAGSAYEYYDKLPEGTAHLLEHLLIGKPNKVLKTKRDVDNFEKGNKEKPSLIFNASTNVKYMQFFVDTHQEGSIRAIQIIRYGLNETYDLDKFLEKEKEIVIAERQLDPKREKDSYYHSLQFLFKDSPEFITNVLGEEESIRSITKNDLEVIYNRIKNTTTSAITIQSGQELTDDEKHELNLLTKDWSTEAIEKMKKSPINKNFRVGAFEDPKKTGINMSFVYFEEKEKAVDYKKNLLSKIFRTIISSYGYDILREELGLIYGIQTFSNSSYLWEYSNRGFILTFSPENLEETLEKIDYALKEGLEGYINSDRGREIFESELSYFIFQKTIGYNRRLAMTFGTDCLLDQDFFEKDKEREIAESLTIEDMKEYVKDSFIKKNPHIWVDSSEEVDDIIEEIMESPLNVKES